MKQLKYTKKFLFNHAQYFASNEKGCDLLLKIDYQNNSFVVENIGQSLDQKIKQELEDFAKDLLNRKHGVNFAKQ